jgi:transcriptional regulator with XRE-family HTH domain
VHNALTAFDTVSIVLLDKNTGEVFNHENQRESMGRKPPFQSPSWRPRVQARMRELKIRQIDLARGLGVTTRGAIGHYFCGRRHMTAEQLVAMAKVLQWSVAQVLGEENGNGTKFKPPQDCFVMTMSTNDLYELLKIYQPCPDSAKPSVLRAFSVIAKEISAQHK